MSEAIQHFPSAINIDIIFANIDNEVVVHRFYLDDAFGYILDADPTVVPFSIRNPKQLKNNEILSGEKYNEETETPHMNLLTREFNAWEQKKNRKLNKIKTDGEIRMDDIVLHRKIDILDGVPADNAQIRRTLYRLLRFLVGQLMELQRGGMRFNLRRPKYRPLPITLPSPPFDTVCLGSRSNNRIEDRVDDIHRMLRWTADHLRTILGVDQGQNDDHNARIDDTLTRGLTGIVRADEHYCVRRIDEIQLDYATILKTLHNRFIATSTLISDGAMSELNAVCALFWLCFSNIFLKQIVNKNLQIAKRNRDWFVASEVFRILNSYEAEDDQTDDGIRQYLQDSLTAVPLPTEEVTDIMEIIVGEIVWTDENNSLTQYMSWRRTPEHKKKRKLVYRYLEYLVADYLKKREDDTGEVSTLPSP